MSYLKPLVDAWGRRVTHLRISLTESCNFRCVYCAPDAAFRASPAASHLSAEEIQRFVAAAARAGVTGVRLTGGEPLLRQDLTDIIRRLKLIRGIQDVSLTTNGSLLEPLIGPLKDAGLDRLNISLDSLDRVRFQTVTGADAYDCVHRAVFAAMVAGFPVKLNIVVLSNLSNAEVRRFIDLATVNPLEVRFLEFMPLCGSAWKGDEFVPIHNVRRIVENLVGLDPLPREGHVAQVFQIRNGLGRVGFIASLTESFCRDCSRFRLSADGRIFPCLFSGRHVSVRDLLRRRAPHEELLAALRLAADIKPRGNSFHDDPFAGTAGRSPAALPAGAVEGFDPNSTPLIRRIGG